jgi:predicted cupin superfamily sugar epimerase
MTSYSAQFWINRLGLTRHPEGGFFKEVYRSGEVISKKGLPERYTSFRPFSTSIYFLLESHDFSAFHRLKSDEVWHFYLGSPLTLYILKPTGDLSLVVLGDDPEKGHQLQFTVGMGCWFAAKVNEPGTYSLLGCAVSPGFDFEDFELGHRDDLIRKFPKHQKLIEGLSLL